VLWLVLSGYLKTLLLFFGLSDDDFIPAGGRLL
jgi:hypothetical protein